MTTPYPQVVLLGDSLFEQSVIIQDGFSLHIALQEHLVRRFDVVNRGFSGWNTDNVMCYMNNIFQEPSPFSPKIHYLVVLLGANDASRPSLGDITQHVPIDIYKENLHKIINHPRIKPHEPTILLVTPPPVDEIKMTKLDIAEGHPAVLRTSNATAKYAQMVREVARENPGVILIDLWQAIMTEALDKTPDVALPEGMLLGSVESGKQGALDHLFPDGLHMGSEAYKIFYKLVLPYFQVLEDKTDYTFPDWRVVKAGRVVTPPTPVSDN